MNSNKILYYLERLFTRLSLTLFAIVLLCSCGSEDDNGAVDTKDIYRVRVNAKALDSAVSDMVLPIRLAVYKSDRSLLKESLIEDYETPFQINLSSSDYVLSAVSGNCTFTDGFQRQPLMMGMSNITVSKTDVDANITLNYAVAKVNVILEDIPSDVIDVEICLANVYTRINDFMEMSDKADANVSCTQLTDGKWTTGDFYVLPAAVSSTKLTIILKYQDSSTKSYSVSYPYSLTVGTPYVFSGSFKGEPSSYNVNCYLLSSEWAEEVQEYFTIMDTDNGSSSDDKGDSNLTDIDTSKEIAVITTDKMPTEGYVCGGFVVVCVDADGMGLLLSKKEWTKLSVRDLQEENLCNEINAYSESGLNGWIVPSYDQAKAITDRWKTEQRVVLEQTLASVDAGKLSTSDRYLCADGNYTYSYKITSQALISSGSTVNDYRLRLVKPVRFVVK